MRVLMIDHFMPHSFYTDYLCDQMKDKVDVTVLCKRNAPCEKKGIVYKNKLYIGWESKPLALLHYAQALSATAKEIRHGKYDVLHVQTFKSEKLEIPLYIRLRKHYGILVHTVHNVLPHEAEPKHIRMYGRFYEECDILFVHNKASKEKLFEIFPELNKDKVFIVPHGSYPVEKTEPVKHKKTNFLLFGLIRKYKGIDLLIKAVSKMNPEIRKQCSFLIAGFQDDIMDDTDYGKMIEDCGVEDSVRFLNRRIAEEELPKLYEKTDYCVFPYREIYGSGSLLMAYSYGKPVIASDVSAFREETDEGRCGILFRNKDIGDLAKALEKAAALTEEESEIFSNNIRKLTENKYNWEMTANKTVLIYKKYM